MMLATSLFIREMHIKTIIRDHFTLTRMTIFKKETISFGKHMETMGLHTLLAGCKMAQPLWKPVCSSSEIVT